MGKFYCRVQIGNYTIIRFLENIFGPNKRKNIPTYSIQIKMSILQTIIEELALDS